MQTKDLQKPNNASGIWTWSTGAKDAVNSKIRLYGVRNSRRHLRDQLMTKLGEDITPDMDLGIEWAHSALGTRTLDNAAPRSIVIKFLKFTTKEKVH